MIIYINCLHNMFAYVLSYIIDIVSLDIGLCTVHNMVQQFLKKLSSWVGMSKTLKTLGLYPP